MINITSLKTLYVLRILSTSFNCSEPLNSWEVNQSFDPIRRDSARLWETLVTWWSRLAVAFTREFRAKAALGFQLKEYPGQMQRKNLIPCSEWKCRLVIIFLYSWLFSQYTADIIGQVASAVRNTSYFSVFYSHVQHSPPVHSHIQKLHILGHPTIPRSTCLFSYVLCRVAECPVTLSRRVDAFSLAPTVCLLGVLTTQSIFPFIPTLTCRIEIC